MKFLVIADLHEEEIILEKLPAILEQEKPDYLIIAGDFTKPRIPSISYVEDVLNLYSKILAIPGNCDPPKVLELIEERGFSIHEKRKELGNSGTEKFFRPICTEPNEIGHKQTDRDYLVGSVNGLNIIGFGYSSITPFGTPGELEEEEILRRMSKLSIDQKTILVTHAPPEGILDANFKGDHIGSSSIKQIIEKKPFLHLFAHVHECEGTTKVGETTFVKIPAAKNQKFLIIEIKNREIKVENRVF